LLELLRLEAETGWANLGAAEALGMFGVKDAVPDLTVLLVQEIEGTDVPPELMAALKRLDAGAGMAAVVEFLERGNPRPRRFNAALNELCTKGLMIRYGCCRDAPRLPRGEAVGVLAELGGRCAIPALLKLMVDRDRPVRRAASYTLIRLADRDAWRERVGLLGNEDGYVRQEAARALGRLGVQEALPELVPLLHDPNHELRAAVAWSVGRLGGDDVVAALLPLLEDEDRWVRIEGASQIVLRGREEGIPIIMREAWSLNSMNALRQPDLWRRLAKTPLPGKLHGRMRDLLAEVARRVGLCVEIPDALGCLIESDLSCERKLDPERCHTLQDALDDLGQGIGHACFIMESDRIRVLPRGEAWRFWKDWLMLKKKE
jgi:hypothetical protein